LQTPNKEKTALIIPIFHWILFRTDNSRQNKSFVQVARFSISTIQISRFNGIFLLGAFTTDFLSNIFEQVQYYRGGNF
jgi:hypothetical protein